MFRQPDVIETQILGLTHLIEHRPIELGLRDVPALGVAEVVHDAELHGLS
jgi:hypothetical protein